MKKYLLYSMFLLAGTLYSCDNAVKEQTTEEATADTAVLKDDDRMENPTNGIEVTDADAWKDIDLDVPTVSLPEINTKDIELRGNDRYTVYSVDETILFDTDKAQIRQQAENNLQQVATSLKQRYNEGNIRIYGFTDARASKEYNKELSEERAQAVKQWLTDKGGIDGSRVSIHPMGEQNPEATNKTAEGRQQNRRVEIVAMNPEGTANQ